MYVRCQQFSNSSTTRNALLSGGHMFASLLLLLLLLVTSSHQMKCPSGCTGCIINRLFCKDAGSELPSNVPNNVNSITIIRYTLRDTTLTKKQISLWGTPRLKVKKIIITMCNIANIESGAFDTLTELTYLDLSGNRLTVIRPDTFMGLKLNKLSLWKNRGLQLGSSSFRGLRVEELSLKDCRLKTLKPAVLVPISSHLKTLTLSENNFTTIDPAMDPLFRRLDRLDLSKNEIECSCSVQWLVEVFRASSAIRSLQHRDGNDDDNKPNTGVPLCRRPKHLKDKPLDTLSPHLFYCSGPRLTSISVDWVSTGAGTLKCQAKGSPSMNVRWKYKTQSDVYVHPNAVKKPSEKAAIIFDRSKFGGIDGVQHFQCIVDDVKGRAAADVKIRWPASTSQPRPPITVDKSVPNGGRQTYEEPGGPGTNSRGGRQSTDRSASGDKVKKENFDSFLFAEKFSLIEMIGAVVGTFSLTLLLFIVIASQCFVCSGGVLKKRRQPGGSSVGGSGASNNSSAPHMTTTMLGRSPKKSYPNFEINTYSDCQTYDLPQHNTTYPSLPPPPPPPSSLPPPPTEPFLDFRTQRTLYNGYTQR